MAESYRLDGELDACPACSSAQIRHLDVASDNREQPTSGPLPFVTGCDACGCIFVNPQPSEQAVTAYYSRDGGWNARKSDERSEDDAAWPAMSSGRRSRSIASLSDEDAWKSSVNTVLVNARTLFGPELKGRTVFDFGCGHGRLLDRLAAYGLETTGLDPATAHLVTRHRMLDEVPETPTFDIIAAIHVLEHVPNPNETLRRLRRALRPGGLFVCGMPALDGLEKHRKKRYIADPIMHINAYTRRSLSAQLAKAGFQAIAFYPGTKPQRFRCAALWSDSPDPVEDPLRDAEAAFRKFRETDRRHAEPAPRSVRALASMENAAREADRTPARSGGLRAGFRRLLGRGS